MKYYQLFSILTISISTVSCAITSGLQTYDLPNQGSYKTDQGAELSVVQLTQENLPTLALSQINSSANLNELFNIKHTLYRLSSGDILSIQLWAYPEITPPIKDSRNIKAAGYPIDSRKPSNLGSFSNKLFGKFK